MRILGLDWGRQLICGDVMLREGNKLDKGGVEGKFIDKGLQG